MVNLALFEQVFERLESAAIDGIVKKIVESIETDTKTIIDSAKPEDIKQFFADTIVIEADLKDLQVAEEKITPTPPVYPQLSDAEYAAQVLERFGDVAPSKDRDKVFLNLFVLVVPEKVYTAKTEYPTAQLIFSEEPNRQFPVFHLQNGMIFTFDKIDESALRTFVDLNSISSIHLEDFVRDRNNARFITIILNRWIRRKCKRKKLEFDPRTSAYFFPKKVNDESPVTITWIPRSKRSTRELTKPMTRGRKTNYWVHRAAIICARRFWGKYYVQIRPRFLFSPDGLNLYQGARTDALDRTFRKSIYSRNLNQLYDVLFWYRYVFPEANTRGSLALSHFIGENLKQSIRVREQVRIDTECKPNIEIPEEVEQLDRIEEITAETKTLDDFMRGEEI